MRQMTIGAVASVASTGIVRTPDDIDPEAMPPFMQAFLRFSFRGSEARR